MSRITAFAVAAFLAALASPLAAATQSPDFCQHSARYQAAATLYDLATHVMFANDYRTGDALLQAGLTTLGGLDYDKKPGAVELDDTGQMEAMASLMAETGKFKDAVRLRKQVLSSRLGMFRGYHACNN